MTRGPFDPSFEELPRVIAAFPLTGVLLLPGGRLPLNIFEPRYLAMTRAALATAQRLIGMVQPTAPTPEDNRGPTAAVRRGEQPGIYRTGCAGRITAFSETDDGRYLLTLTGVSRFDVADELAPSDGYRRIIADYGRFRGDLDREAAPRLDRARLLAALRPYFAERAIDANWDAIEKTPDGPLVTSLAMTCPFDAAERQALLEAADAAERARVLVALLEMSAAGSGRAAGH